jgi:hypothetical protein
MRSRRSLKRLGLLVSFGALSLAATCSPASAAVSIGQTGTPFVCDDNLAFLMGATGHAPSYTYTASPEGVVTSWSAAADLTPGRSLQLLILRPDPSGGLNHYVAVGKDEVRPLTALGQLNTFTGLHLTIRPGEQIGLFLPDGQPGGESMCGFSSNDLGDVIRNNSPAGGEPPLGVSLDFPDNEQGLRVNASAVVEPDADNDGFGDETQDRCLSATGPMDGCPSNVFSFGAITRNKKKGTATITVNLPNPGELTGSGNGVKASSAGPVVISKSVGAGQAQLLIKATGKKKRKLNETGKVKLNVSITYTPTGGNPGTQSVKVKLKKKL